MKMRSLSIPRMFSRGIYTPKMFLHAYAKGGGGWGVRAYYTTKSAYHMHAKKSVYTHVKTVFGVYATRNDIRAIDTNLDRASG